MAEKKDISIIALSKLCNTCGACLGVCPCNAICFRETTGGYYLPVVDKNACKKCGLCYEVCPGVNFGDTLMCCMPEDPFAGCALETFVGKAASNQLFDNSQSGGIVSALLLYALESRRIKGAVTVTMKMGSPPRPAVRIAVNKQDILHSQKSKYCPVPLLGFIKDLRNYDGPVAVVGTSCQIHGLINVLDKIPGLKQKIAFTIGLVCERVLTYSALDYLLESASNNKDELRILHFRDKSSGYPGDVSIVSYDKRSVIIPSKIRMQIKDYFTPVRCRLCFDKMNVFSDITVGDPHGLNCVDRKHGESMMVVRSRLGQEIVHNARADRIINIRPFDYDQVLNGQGVFKKKEEWSGYTGAWEKSGRELPGYSGRVKNHANTVLCGKKYKKDIEHSLSLDNFPSRKELIRFVYREIRKKQVVDILLKPVRLARGFAGKIAK